MVQAVTYQSDKQSVYFQGKLIVLENLTPVLSPEEKKKRKRVPGGGARDRSGSDAGTVRKRERIKALFLRRIAGDIADVRAKA